MADILIIYASQQPKLRVAIKEHLYSFKDNATKLHINCIYINLAIRSIPAAILQHRFDLIVFHTIFLWERVNPPLFNQWLARAQPLKKLNAAKIVLPQDEYLCNIALCDFINDFKIQHIFSVMPQSAWGKIYAGIDPHKTQIHPILTGYLSDHTVAKMLDLAINLPREIDVGYRASHPSPALGQHGRLKFTLGTAFAQAAKDTHLRIDISNQKKDVFWGQAWYQFLLRCKYTLGVEGGASVMDPYGLTRQKVYTFVKQHPGASFDEIRQACFEGLDYETNLVALSPRHLEACMTRTCQILIEGDYSGILKPDFHYIPLKRDFSNINEVVKLISNDNVREEIVNNAYHDIAMSDDFRYTSMLRTILIHSLGQCLATPQSLATRGKWWFYCFDFIDKLSWIAVKLHPYWAGRRFYHSFFLVK